METFKLSPSNPDSPAARPVNTPGDKLGEESLSICVISSVYHERRQVHDAWEGGEKKAGKWVVKFTAEKARQS